MKEVPREIYAELALTRQAVLEMSEAIDRLVVLVCKDWSTITREEVLARTRKMKDTILKLRDQ